MVYLKKKKSPEEVHSEIISGHDRLIVQWCWFDVMESVGILDEYVLQIYKSTEHMLC